MKLIRTALPDVVLLETPVFDDARGWFTESYNEREFHAALAAAGLPAPRPFVQDNQSMSHRGVLRGLHYQLPPHAQGKLVRVAAGAAYDVAVDIRRGSPTFGRWAGARLDARSRHQMWIPEGFAHGFLALEDDTQVIYKVTDYWHRDRERAIRWDDADIGVAWPLGEVAPLVAEKDRLAAELGDADVFE